MEVATLHHLFPGRVQVGVGHGVQEWMRQVGAHVESPVTLLREYLSALRALLRGEEVTTQGRYVRLDKVALDWPPAPVPIVLAGAVGPRSLRLCGEVADGTILTAGTTPDGVREACRLIEEGRAAAGRDQPHPVTVYLLAATGPGAGEHLQAEVQSWGGDPAQVGVAGDAQTVAAAVQRWAAAGADTVVLQPTADDPDPEGFMHFVARDVRPLVP
jgi:alkanesulfonate monooxygenase SsuD/methylene tetrahydromethanopterin reductase-like flavin-dependent oxidoreductase (luciferase family)